MSSWVCSGEMQTLGQSAMPPYAFDPSGAVKRWTAGSRMSIPIPAGTVTCVPLTYTSRWAWT